MQVLLLGGHGKIASHLTPLLLNRALNVTSVIRNPDHEKEILALGKGRKGNLKVLISSLADIKSAADAQRILNSVMPDYVVWSAGTQHPRTGSRACRRWNYKSSYNYDHFARMKCSLTKLLSRRRR